MLAHPGVGLSWGIMLRMKISLTDIVKKPLIAVKKSASKTVGGKQRRLVALDIGTEYVKALIGDLKNEQIDIIGLGKIRQGLGDMHSGAIADIEAVAANCDKALSRAEAMAGVSVAGAVIGIAGELVKGNTSTIHYRRPDSDKEITYDEMNYILKRVHKRAYNRAREQVAWETGNKELEIKLVNSAIVAINIDSYRVSNPIGFKGRDIAISIYTAYAPVIHIGAIERVASELDLELLAVAAEPFAVTRAVIGTDASSNLSAITIDVGGGTTDIAVVNEGGVEGTRMFGIGGRAFTKTIAAELNVDYGEAEKLKLSFSKESGPALRRAVEKTLSVWLDGVALALEEYEGLEHLPSRVLLCGGGAGLLPLTEALSSPEWSKTVAFTKTPKVKLIEPGEVANIRNQTRKPLDHTFITAMGLLRVGADTINIDESETIKDKLNRLLKT